MNTPDQRPPARPPWRLMALALVVLLAHGWLLTTPLAPAEAAPALAPPTLALQIRTVALAPAAAPAPASTPQGPTPRARAAAATSTRTTPAPTAPTAPSAAMPDTMAVQAQPTGAPPPALLPEPPPDPPTPAEATPTAPPAEPPPDAALMAAAPPAASDTAAAPRPPAPLPFVPPPPAALRYAVQAEFRGVSQTLDGTLDWQHDGHSYRMHMVVSLGFLGSRVQTSEGQIGPGGLAPRRFSEKTRSERAAHFDPARGRIRYSANTPDALLLPGHQDRLSVFFQLAGLAQGRPDQWTPGQTVDLPVSGSRDSETWTFEVLDAAPIALPQGATRALHLRRLPRKAFDSTVEVWLAPDRGHLPVRMRITQANGDVADQRLMPP